MRKGTIRPLRPTKLSKKIHTAKQNMAESAASTAEYARSPPRQHKVHALSQYGDNISEFEFFGRDSEHFGTCLHFRKHDTACANKRIVTYRQMIEHDGMTPHKHPFTQSG